MFHSLVSNIPQIASCGRFFYFLIGVCMASLAIGYSNSISHFARGEGTTATKPAAVRDGKGSLQQGWVVIEFMR